MRDPDPAILITAILYSAAVAIAVALMWPI